MAECIEREALLARLKLKEKTDTTRNHAKFRGLESAMAQVKKAPAADVAPVVHGRWELNKVYGDYECSVCKQGDVLALHFKRMKLYYCPNCGARMDGE